ILLKNFWKIRAEDFIRGVEITRKRIDALERLKQEQQIPANIYEELRKIYMRDMGELDNKIAELSSELNRVREELKNRLSTLVKVRSVNQVHFSTGEIDEISYKAAENIIESSLDITLLEIKEVESILARLKNIKQKIAPESIAQQRVSSFIELLKSMNTVRQQNNDSPLVVHLQSTIQSQ
ncbi:MAG: CdvA-like protein, partial [Thermoproteota archaeon]